MSYELYCLSGSCSMACHVILNELGQDAKIHLMSREKNEIKSPEYMKLNPRGNVPMLVDDGKTLREGAAIITYLCDTHGSDLMPKSGWDRAQALQWLMFANATLHPAYSRTFWISRNLPAEQQEAALKAARAQIQDLWNEVEAHLATSGPYMCGAKCTVADIMLTVIANWNPQAYQFGPKTKAMFRSVIARPAYQKALAFEQVEYKAAA